MVLAGRQSDPELDYLNTQDDATTTIISHATYRM